MGRFDRGSLPEDSKQHVSKVLLHTDACPPGTWVVATRGKLHGRVGIVRKCIGKYEVRVQLVADGTFSVGKVSTYRLAKEEEKIEGVS